jgi:NADPH:quinone reductase-like Zn-dependent oxidoreductase
VTYGTALLAIEDRGGARSGETMVVLGAAGGTGVAACELGRLLGLHVIACASSDDKLAFALDGAPMSDLPELELCDEVRATLTREIGGVDERIACLQSSRKILAGYLRKGTKRSAPVSSTS